MNPGQKAGGQKAEVEKVWPMNMGSFMIKTFKSDVLQEAEQLQHKNLIQIKWADGYRGSDIERIRYRLEDKEKFYALYQQEVDAEFLPKQEKIRLYQEFLRNQLAQVKKLWIRAYYQDLLERSENKRKKIFWNY